MSMIFLLFYSLVCLRLGFVFIFSLSLDRDFVKLTFNHVACHLIAVWSLPIRTSLMLVKFSLVCKLYTLFFD